MKVTFQPTPNVPGNQTPALWMTPGIDASFVKIASVENNPKDVGGAVLVHSALAVPVQGLQTSFVASGALQVVPYYFPKVSADVFRGNLFLLAFDLSIQLNDFDIPATDFEFIIDLLDQEGNPINGATQKITGNASKRDGNTKQYIRFLPFQQRSSFKGSSAFPVVSEMDGRLIYFPRVGAYDVASLTTAVAALTASVQEVYFSEMGDVVSAVQVTVPPSSITADVVVTLTPMLAGRTQAASDLANALQTGVGIGLPMEMTLS